MISRSNYILLLLLFIGLIVFSMGSSIVGVEPYKKVSLFKQEHPYEGFRTSLSPSYVLEQPSNLSNEFNIQLNNNVNSNNGYNSLISTSYTNEQPLDSFSSTAGSISCNGYGYSNSQGGLCMTPENMAMLSSRGGNSTRH